MALNTSYCSSHLLFRGYAKQAHPLTFIYIRAKVIKKIVITKKMYIFQLLIPCESFIEDINEKVAER